MFRKAHLLFLLSVFVLSPVWAQEAEWVEVEPEVGPWNYHVMYGHGYAKITEADFEAGLLPFLNSRADYCTPIEISDRGTWVEGNYCGFNDALQSIYGVAYSRHKRPTLVVDSRQVCTGSPTKYEYQPHVCSSRDVTCPDGAEAYGIWPDDICRIRKVEPIPPNKDSGCGKDGGDKLTGNPCNVATGNKFRSETDISTGAMIFTRYYNSEALQDYGLGKGWRGSHQKLMYIADGKLVLMSEAGRAEEWSKVGDAWVGDADSDVQIIQDSNGYQVTNANGSYERYSFSGFITSKTNAAGETTTYSYNPGWRLRKIQDPYYYSTNFTWENGRISAVSVGSGFNVYKYEYDEIGNLVAVISPSGTLYDYDYSDNPRKTYHYENPDFPHHLTGITDENGDRYATFAYDASGKAIESELAQTTNAVGQEKIQINYQTGSSVVTDAVGTQVQWSFQETLGANKLTSKINVADGKGITQTWDTNGNLLTRTDAEGRTTSYTYNATNQRTSMTVASSTPEQRTSTYEYVSPDIDLVTKTSVPSVFANNLKETINTYDADLNITSTTVNGYDTQGNAVTRTTSFTYDDAGNVTSIDGPRTDVNDVTTIEYHQNSNNLKKVTNALGHESRYDQYDPNGRLKRRYDENGTRFQYSYDPRGWLISIIEAPSSGYRTTSYEYDDVGQLIKVTQPDKSTQNYVYDASHSLREVTDSLGNKVSYSYDAKGNRSNESVHDPDGTLLRNINTTYDIRNFIESINDGGSITQMVNDAVGNLNSQTDPNANPSTTHSFDALDRLNNTVDALTNTSGYDYNVADQLTQVTAPNGALTQYEYDDLGNQTKEISADRGTITYTHDAAGNVVSMTDARGIVTNYSYDVLNRVIAVTRANAQENVAYTYDANQDLCGLSIGRLCKQEDESGTQNFNYDIWGNLARRDLEALGETYTTSFVYDGPNRLYEGLNRLTEVTYPNGRKVNYTRDAIGRITDVSTSANGTTTALISNRTYRADGLSTGQTYGNGFANTRSYDAQGRLTENTLPSSGANTYSYDNNGNILSISDSLANRQYNYDVLDRLLGADNTGELTSYAYDANGNRLSIDRNGVAQSLIYEASANGATNRLDTLDGVSLSRDAAGNTLSDKNGSRQFTYNGAGRLSSINVSGDVTNYVYNASGLRTQKVSATETIIYHYDLNGQLILEQALNSGDTREYIYVDNELVAYFNSAAIQGPKITSPAEGSVLTSTSQVFTWESGLTVTDWKLELGSEISAKDYFESGSLGSATTVSVTTLPEDGTEVFARLWYQVDGTWYIHDTVYTSVANIAPTPTTGTYVNMLSPNQGVNPSGDIFTWEGSSDITSWWLYLGTNYVGGSNVLDTGNIGLTTSATMGAVPGGESLLYARMWYIAGGGWITKDYTYGIKQNWADVTMAYVHTDHLGTPRVLSDAAQTVVWQAGDDAFGDVAPVVENVVFNVRFPGQYYDVESGLHYNWNRYYDPTTGRYVTSDPIGLMGGANTYGYVLGNPLRYIDPRGLDANPPFVFEPRLRPGNAFTRSGGIIRYFGQRGGGFGVGFGIGVAIGNEILGGTADGLLPPDSPISPSPFGPMPEVMPKPLNDDKFCGPKDPCMQWYITLKRIYDLLGTMSDSPNLAAKKRDYNQRAKVYNLRCPKKLPLFGLGPSLIDSI